MSKSISVNLNETALDSIVIIQDNLFPESVEYNPNTGQLLLSSVLQGTIFTTNEDGSVSPFIEDERLISSIGLAISEEQNRLFVVNSDVGSSTRSSPETENQLAALGIFDLSTGEPIDYVDLSSLRPGEPHSINDIDIDDEGNAYVTDSLSPIIYKVDPEGKPSILLEDEQFIGEGFNLNGIIVHPDNFLIVADSNDGLLYKVPLDNPEQFTQVQLDQTLVNADGLLLADEDELLVVTHENIPNQFNGEASNRVLNLQSNDNWQSAEIVDELDLGDDAFPTTASILDGEILVLDGQFDIFLGGETTDESIIQTVGSINTQNQCENRNATDIVPIFSSNNSDQLFADMGDLIFEGNDNDTLDASVGRGNNHLFGDEGNDILLAGSNDRLVDGDGDDSLFVTQEGGNLLTGGSGVDAFWIVNGEIPNVSSTITDFIVGTDVVSFGGLYLSFSDLIIEQIAVDSSISLGQCFSRFNVLFPANFPGSFSSPILFNTARANIGS